jgi:hydrogenase maturation factor
VLNEFAVASGVGMRLDESSLPLKPEVRGTTVTSLPSLAM